MLLVVCVETQEQTGQTASLSSKSLKSKRNLTFNRNFTCIGPNCWRLHENVSQKKNTPGGREGSIGEVNLTLRPQDARGLDDVGRKGRRGGRRRRVGEIIPSK